MLVIPEIRRLRWEDQKFEASLGPRVRPCLKKKNQKTTNIDNLDAHQQMNA
jgi:hypothetical protein